MFENFSQISEKVAKWFGEQVNFGAGERSPPSHMLAKLFDQYPLSSLLPYESYDPETHLFFNKKSIGFILENSPLTGAGEQTIQILSNILTDVLPAGTDLQLLVLGSPKVGELIDSFVEMRAQQSGIYAWLANKREAFLKKGIWQTLSSEGPFVLRDFRFYLVVSQSQKKEGKIEQLLRVREEMVSSLASVQINSRHFDANQFLTLMNDFINPNSSPYSEKMKWNEEESLAIQLTDPEYQVQVYPNKIKISSEDEDWDVRCLSVKDFPSTASLGNMHEQLGQLYNSANQIPCPFIISFHIRPEESEKSSTRAQMQFTSKDSTAKSQLAKFKPTIHKEHQDWGFVRDRLSEGDRLVKVYYQIVLYAHADKANDAETKVKNLFKSIGWKLRKQSFLQFQSWLTMLPMMMSEGMFDDLKLFGRLRTLNAFAAINLLPLIGEWKGSRRPSLLLPGRRGQVAIWNPFDNQGGNYNVAIAATSGSGKSAFTQEYIVALVSSGGRVWVIDVGRSYEKTCKILGGEFIEFRTDQAICINPFSFITHFDQSLEMLKPLFAAMARPNSLVSDEEMAWLEKALKAAWTKEGNKATVTTVTDWLSIQSDSICQRLSHLLFSYSKDGMYGKYFEGECSLNIDNPFVTLELEELKSKKDLQKIVLFALMYQISERMYLGSRVQTKSCIIDEAWDLLGGENAGAASFIETGYRRARRYNANFVTITQSINDYFKNATSIAAYENSAYKIILRQEPDALNQLGASGRLDMDEYTLKLLKSLKTTKDYAECVIKSGQGVSLHRIIFDPYSLILYSSKGSEFEAVKQLQAKGISLQNAIEQIANERTD